MIELRDSGGAPTVESARATARNALFEEVSQHPLVKAALDIFPGAKLVDVIDNETLPTSETGEAEQMDE